MGNLQAFRDLVFFFFFLSDVVYSPTVGNLSLVQLTASGSSSQSILASGTPRCPKHLEASLTKENQELKKQMNRMAEEVQ